tara:strand:+ start:479 stop:781 length:303 start_codon:yes stop_codon:yes gene_type:complete
MLELCKAKQINNLDLSNSFKHPTVVPACFWELDLNILRMYRKEVIRPSNFPYDPMSQYTLIGKMPTSLQHMDKLAQLLINSDFYYTNGRFDEEYFKQAPR